MCSKDIFIVFAILDVKHFLIITHCVVKQMEKMRIPCERRGCKKANQVILKYTILILKEWKQKDNHSLRKQSSRRLPDMNQKIVSFTQ